MKKMKRAEQAPPPGGSVERLRKEWEYFQESGRCPKCNAVILGPSIVYDDVCDKMPVLSCICGKHIYPDGDVHLKEADHQTNIPRKGLTHRRNPMVSV